ncbi:MAG: hypothetical protein AABZ02_08040 [Bacteroidota bacterium]
MTEEVQKKEPLFGVIAEVEGRNKQLVLLNLTFGRLIDEIVVPYDTDESFFLDGVPVTRNKITRIKIISLTEKFEYGIRELERGLTRGEHQNQKIYGDQYETRFEHVLRTDAEDVTSQIIKAYNQAVKPRLKDYIPKREELISAATTLFVEAMKALAR